MLLGVVTALCVVPWAFNQMDRARVRTVTRRETLPAPLAGRTAGPLRVHPANGRYFADATGRAILLAGAHTWYTLQDSGWTDPPRRFDYRGFLDDLAARHHNFFRMFVWEQAKGSVLASGDYYYAPLPYERTGPGTALDGRPRFDLTRFNAAYFQRLRQRVQQAGDRGIYVAVQLFEGFSVEAKPFMAANNPWPGHPFNRENNINGIDGDPNGDGQGTEVHTLEVPSVTALQEAYVREVVGAVNDLDNVLYEICNEANAGSEGWQNHLVALIRREEANRPLQHPVGMSVEWPDGDNADLMASDADWVSPNGAGGYWDDPPPADGRKVIVNDTDHLCYPCGDTAFVWRTVLRGLNPAFMDPYDCRNDVASDCDPQAPRWVRLRENLGFARLLSASANLAALAPRPDLCSTAYCLASVGASHPEYLAYLPAGRTATSLFRALRIRDRAVSWPLPGDRRITVDLSAARGELRVDWLDTATGALILGETTAGGGRRTLVAPRSGDVVVHIHHPS